MNQIVPSVRIGTTSASVISVSSTFSVNRIDGDHDHRQRLPDQLSESVLQQLLQVLDVAGHAGHDHARLLLGVVVEAEALELCEDLDAQVVHDPRREATGDARLRALRHRADQDRQQEEPGADGHDSHVVVVRRHAVIDRIRDQRRTELVGDADDADQNHGHHAEAPVARRSAAAASGACCARRCCV